MAGIPTWATNENVNFDGTLTPSILIKTVGTTKYLITWESMTPQDQQRWEDLITDNYAGVLPADVELAMKTNKADNGSTFYDMFVTLIQLIGDTPVAGQDYDRVYYDGTNWVRITTGAIVA